MEPVAPFVDCVAGYPSRLFDADEFTAATGFPLDVMSVESWRLADAEQRGVQVCVRPCGFYIGVVEGAVDVAVVDVRRGEESFLRHGEVHVGVGGAVFVPPAHGFAVCATQDTQLVVLATELLDADECVVVDGAVVGWEGLPGAAVDEVPLPEDDNTVNLWRDMWALANEAAGDTLH